MSWINELVNILSKRRKYASFFDWPDKQIKERGIVGSFIESRVAVGLSEWNCLVSANQDPPDCIAEEDGKKIAIEVTELVCQETIEKNEVERNKSTGPTYYRHWTDAEILGKIREIVIAKDGKCSKINGSYWKTVLLIHSDEFELTGERVGIILEKCETFKVEHLDEAFLMLSYHPPTYPIFQLPTSK